MAGRAPQRGTPGPGRARAEGLIIRQVGRGTFLTDVLHPATVTAPADTSPAEIMEVRRLLEPQVAALAARVATQADLDRIDRCLDAGGASDDFGRLRSVGRRVCTGPSRKPRTTGCS